MASEHLEKKIADWSINLGFRLPDGSPLPPDYFTLLTATPSRRQLWQLLIDSVHPRKKVENMRKQLLAVNLKGQKGNSKKCYPKQATNRLELLKKQILLLKHISKQKNLVMELENNILAKASDLMLEISKTSKLEKHCKECKEQTLVVQLFTKKEKIIIETLESMLKKVGLPRKKIFLNDHCKSFVEDKLKNLNCKSLEHCHDCSLFSKINELCEIGTSEQILWEEVIEHKKTQLKNFSEFIEDLNSKQKQILSKKGIEVEKALKSSKCQLKQKLTEKSLQAILNQTEMKLLNIEIDKTLENIEKLIIRSNDDDNNFCNGKEDVLSILKSYVNSIGIKSYSEFLIKEIARFEEELTNKEERRKQQTENEIEFQNTVKSIDSIFCEINALKLEQEEQNKELIFGQEKLQVIAQKFVNDEVEKNSFDFEEIISRLKTTPDKHLQLFLETPVDASRIVESSLNEGKFFECEYLSHCFNNYGGEFKEIFSALLIIPYKDVSFVLEEIKKRKKFIEETKKFISEKERLSEFQKKILPLTSAQFDSQLHEKLIKESNEILWNFPQRADKLRYEIEFLQKILENWMEQPYRKMIKEAEIIDYKTFKEYEENIK